jgi:RimJ/RimL family protein N-acetyltransferase
MEQFIFIPSITNLEQYGNKGWRWTESCWDEWNNKTKDYRTNRQGDGLWVIGKIEDQQCLGTCQFSLPNNRKAAYSKIRRAGTIKY